MCVSRKAQIRQLAKWVVIVLVVTLLPIIAYSVYNGISCKTALIGFEKSVKDISLSLDEGETTFKELKLPCKSDTAFFVSHVSEASIKKLESNTKIIERMNSKSMPIDNVFLVGNNIMKHSFYVTLANESYDYLCVDLSSWKVNLSFEKKGNLLMIKNPDRKSNCGAVEVSQKLIDSGIISEINKTQDDVSENLPEDPLTMQMRAIDSTEISREITCLNDKFSNVKIKISPVDGRKIKNPSYIEIISKECLKKTGIKNETLDIISPSIGGISDITNIGIYSRKDPIVIWAMKSFKLDGTLLLKYSANACLRKCSAEGIDGILLAEKVFNLDINDEISYLEDIVEEKSRLSAINGFVSKGAFDSALKEADKLKENIKDKETLEIIDDLLTEISSMKEYAYVEDISNSTQDSKLNKEGINNDITVVT